MTAVERIGKTKDKIRTKHTLEFHVDDLEEENKIKIF